MKGDGTMSVLFIETWKDQSTRMIEWGDRRKYTILLLHGLGGTADSWTEVGELLKREYHVVAVDLPGHGRSTALQKLSKEKLIEWLLEVVKLLRKDSVVLMGHSLGAEISIYFNEENPGKVDKLILVDGGYLRDEDFGENLQDVKQAVSQHIRNHRFSSWEDYLQDQRSHPRWNALLEASAISAMVEEDSKVCLRLREETALQYAKMVHVSPACERLHPTLEKPEKYLVIVSRRPKEVNPIRDRGVERLNAEITVHYMDTSHEVCMDDPIGLVEKVKGWLES
jgi:pimeloyl-ACP methyl ester carboxylesterase